MRFLTRAVALPLALAGIWLLGMVEGARAAETPRAVRILFIGNSLTYVNDVPGIVAAMAEAAGETAPVCRAVVGGGFSLEDHWNRGDAAKALEQERWDFVVLQQGPSASPEGRALLLRFARRFDPLIRQAGAKPAMYMVWPSEERRLDFGGVSDSYRMAARDIGAALLPAGEAWRIAERKAPKLKLYSQDGMHPTAAGSYLAGAVIYARLFGRSPAGLPARLTLRSGATVEVSAENAKLLQETAARANEEYGLAAK